MPGTTNEAVVSITDDDVGEVSFEQSSYSVDEGDTVDVTVTLSEDPERTVTVPLTKTEQDGASSADYSGVPASVEFDPGETEKTITFTPPQDSVDDDGESVKLTFGNTLPLACQPGAPTNDRLHHRRRRAVFVDGAFEFSFLLRRRGGRRGSDGDSEDRAHRHRPADRDESGRRIGLHR